MVEVAAQADPPVCRIMDYGKFKYEASPKLDGRNMIMVLAPDKRARAAAKGPQEAETVPAEQPQEES